MQASLFDAPPAPPPPPQAPPPAAHRVPQAPPQLPLPPFPGRIVNPTRQDLDGLTFDQVDALALVAGLAWATDLAFLLARLDAASRPHGRALRRLVSSGHVQHMACGWIRVCPKPDGLADLAGGADVLRLAVADVCRAEMARLDHEHPPFRKYGAMQHHHPWAILDQLADDLEKSASSGSHA